MYTTKAGKTYANPAFGKMMDQDSDSKPEPMKKASSMTKAKDDDHTQTVHIVISTDPGNGGYTTDSGDGLNSHENKSALMDHLSSILPDDDSDSDASPVSDPVSGSGPSTSLMSTVKGMTSK